MYHILNPPTHHVLRHLHQILQPSFFFTFQPRYYCLPCWLHCGQMLRNTLSNLKLPKLVGMDWNYRINSKIVELNDQMDLVFSLHDSRMQTISLIFLIIWIKVWPFMKTNQVCCHLTIGCMHTQKPLYNSNNVEIAYLTLKI